MCKYEAASFACRGAPENICVLFLQAFRDQALQGQGGKTIEICCRRDARGEVNAALVFKERVFGRCVSWSNSF